MQYPPPSLKKSRQNLAGFLIFPTFNQPLLCLTMTPNRSPPPGPSLFLNLTNLKSNFTLSLASFHLLLFTFALLFHSGLFQLPVLLFLFYIYHGFYIGQKLFSIIYYTVFDGVLNTTSADNTIVCCQFNSTCSIQGL